MQPQPGHDRVPFAPEAGVIAAQRQNELARVGPQPPGGEGEATGQADLGIQQPAVIGELGLNQEEPLGGRETGQQPQFNRHQGGLGPGQSHPRQAKQIELQAIANRHRQHRDAVHQ